MRQQDSLRSPRPPERAEMPAVSDSCLTPFVRRSGNTAPATRSNCQDWTINPIHLRLSRVRPRRQSFAIDTGREPSSDGESKIAVDVLSMVKEVSVSYLIDGDDNYHDQQPDAPVGNEMLPHARQDPFRQSFRQALLGGFGETDLIW